MINQISQNDVYMEVNQFIDSIVDHLPYLMTACIVLASFWLASRFFRFFIRKTLYKHSTSRQNLILVFSRVGSLLILVFGGLIAMVIAIPGFTPKQLVGALGISSVVIGFAFKEIFQNLLSGIFILLYEPFRIGDEIQVNQHIGTVEDIQIRATFLYTNDGRRVAIPNAMVYTSTIVINTAYPRRRCQFEIKVRLDSDIAKVKMVIIDVLQRQDSVLQTPVYHVLLTRLENDMMVFSVSWWVDTQQRSNQESSLSLIQAAVKLALEEQHFVLSPPPVAPCLK